MKEHTAVFWQAAGSAGGGADQRVSGRLPRVTTAALAGGGCRGKHLAPPATRGAGSIRGHPSTRRLIGEVCARVSTLAFVTKSSTYILMHSHASELPRDSLSSRIPP